MKGRFQIHKYIISFLPQHSTNTKINSIINTEADYKISPYNMQENCREKSNIYLAPFHSRWNTNKH
jgi:hypothetical protein